MNGSLKIFLFAIFAITLLFTSGCASTLMRDLTKANGGRMDTTYPSVRLAGHTLKNPDMLTPFILLDLPLSAALDTVKLPFDASNAKRAKRGKSVLEAPLTKEQSTKVIEVAIRKAAEKPAGELTKSDLEKVTRLDLYNDKLTYVGNLEKLTQLTWLNLGGNKLISIEGLEKLTQLTRLDLEGNQLTDVKGLEKLMQLKVLDLRSNPDLTMAQIDQLKKSLPNCYIGSNQ